MFFVCMLSSFDQGRGIGKPQRDWAGLLIKRSVIWTWIGYPKHKFARIIIVFLRHVQCSGRLLTSSSSGSRHSLVAVGSLYIHLFRQSHYRRWIHVLHEHNRLCHCVIYLFIIVFNLAILRFKGNVLPSSFSSCVRLLDNPLNINNVLIY